ncbi:hypothetical protein ACKU5V_027455 [Klebsiella pneumoniae]
MLRPFLRETATSAYVGLAAPGDSWRRRYRVGHPSHGVSLQGTFHSKRLAAM